MSMPDENGTADVPDPVTWALDVGAVAEANRRIFHPIGLAIGVTDEGALVLAIDARADEEGVAFDPSLLPTMRARAETYKAEVARRRPARRRRLGFAVQPLEP